MLSRALLFVAALLMPSLALGAEVDQARLSTFQAGTTTKAQVRESLGEPLSESSHPDGQSVLVYGYSGAGADGAAAQNGMAGFLFGADDKLVHIRLYADERYKPASAAPANRKPETPAECQARLNNAVKCYVSKARTGYLLCKTDIGIALLQNQTPDLSCVAKTREQVQPFFDAAQQSLAGKDGEAQLKEAQSYWLETLSGLSANGPPTRQSFPDLDRRADEMDLRMKQLAQAQGS